MKDVVNHKVMHRIEYHKPVVEELFSPSSVICTSPGIDPGGSGHDFNWGNDNGIVPGGSGDDFNWGY